MAMSNKQTIVIFAAGILLLLLAFWAGLTVTRKGGAETAAQTVSPAPAQPGQVAPQQAAEADPDARYVVLVGIFGTEEKAKELKATLVKQNYWSTQIQTASSAGGSKLFRVMIGPYRERERADQVANELTSAGRKGINIEKVSN